MLLGLTAEKTASILGEETDSSSPSAADKNAFAEPGNQTVDSQEMREKQAETAPHGHGCSGAEASTGSERIPVQHESLQPGDSCP